MRLSPDRPLGVAPASLHDYRELARRRMPRQLFDYIDGGAYGETTMAANVADLAAIHLRQRIMRDVSRRRLETTVLGEELSMPVILAPVGLAGMFARRAEVAAVRAAQDAGVQFCESTVSICSIEEVARAARKPPWFQLYMMRDRAYTQDLVSRARACGCSVLVLTVDLAVVGARYRDNRNGLSGALSAWGRVRRLLDILSHPSWVKDVAIGGKPLTFGNLEKAVPGASMPDQFQEWVDGQFDPSVTWDDVAWLRSNWPGKIVVKGVLDAEDAALAVDHGADAVIVSNHGGRQLDTVPSTAAALPRVVEKVDGRAEVLVDGGVRSGLDIVKMLALGARAVLIGRPWAWAVAARGQAGVEHILSIVRKEMDVALALTGANELAELGSDTLVDEGASLVRPIDR